MADLKPGRPTKGANKRTNYTIYQDPNVVADVDDYVADQVAAGNKTYSRSEFYHEAAMAKLKANKLALKRQPRAEAAGN